MNIEENEIVVLTKDYSYETPTGITQIYKAGSKGQVVNIINNEYVTVEFSYKDYTFPVPDVPIIYLSKV